jgi:hypothetical protein
MSNGIIDLNVVEKAIRDKHRAEEIIEIAEMRLKASRAGLIATDQGQWINHRDAAAEIEETPQNIRRWLKAFDVEFRKPSARIWEFKVTDWNRIKAAKGF